MVHDKHNDAAVESSVADPVGSRPFWPDPDPSLNKWLYINFFGVCKKFFKDVCC
jgi:hypothetical protein